MSNTWKNKVLPKIKKFFDKGKKKGAEGVCKSFDSSRESLDKEFEEKGADLSPKVVEIYRSSDTFAAKQLLKKPSEAGVKENPAAVQGLLQELAKAGFPGAQVICDAGKKYGPAYLSGPIVYLFEKASVYLSEEPLPEEPKEEKTREMTPEDVKAAEPASASASAPTEGEAAAAAGATPPNVEKDEALKDVKEPEVAPSPPPAAAEETQQPATTGPPAAASADDPPPAASPAPPPPEKTD